MFRDVSAVNKQSLFADIFDYLAVVVIEYLPHLPIFNSLKSYLMRWRGAIIGARIKLLSGIWIDRFSSLQIGDDVSLAKDIIMVATGGIQIGDRTMIGYGTTILTANHRIPKNRGPMRFSGTDLKKVIIENDVWIGTRVVLMPGITVGEGSIVGAGAVVNKDVPPFSIVGGVPAIVIRMRD